MTVRLPHLSSGLIPGSIRVDSPAAKRIPEIMVIPPPDFSDDELREVSQAVACTKPRLHSRPYLYRVQCILLRLAKNSPVQAALNKNVIAAAMIKPLTISERPSRR